MNEIEYKIEKYNYLLNDICGYKLDDEQKEFVIDDSNSTLLIASAGSGKTLCIIGKIRYLIESGRVKQDEILCISYTNETVNNLKNKLLNYYNYDINVLTFHKLALNFLDNKIEGIVSSDYLDYIIEEYFKSTIYMNNKMVRVALKYLDIPFYKKEYLKGNTSDLYNLKKLLSKFIHLFKSNDYSLSEFSNIYKKNNLTILYRRKNKLFLKLAFNIYQIYMEELSSTLKYDFNDIINMAKNNIPSNCKYKYIIIDEYQDTSIVRLNLIKEIINKTKAKLIVVGDDYQSIYRFTGCDLDVFLNFNKYFKDAKIMYISTTYRNSYELIYVANNFIIKNKYQFKKNIMSNKKCDKPINIVFYSKYKNELNKLLDKIKNTGDVLILGRNTFDIYKYIDKNIIDKNGYINIDSRDTIRYLTVHKSKGLESDNVIIINLENSMFGFPNKVLNDDVLKYVITGKEKYTYDEERRLFYVALTRTKNNVYLLVNNKSVSVFVSELMRDYKKYINYLTM